MSSKNKKNMLLFVVIVAAILFFSFLNLKKDETNEPSSEILSTEAITKEISSERQGNDLPETEAAGDEETQRLEQTLSQMTLEEKVAQMFIITPEALAGSEGETSASEAFKEAMDQYPVGGLVYFAANIQSGEQLTSMISSQQQYSKERTGLPLFISIDEEGGDVARIANDSPIPVEKFPKLSEIGAASDIREAGRLGNVIGSYLSELGFNLDFAPVADVLTNPENTVVKDRSFGTDQRLVSKMVLEEMKMMQQQGIYACIKHFPGHGATAGDTHKGFAYTDKTLEEMQEQEMVPFADAAAHGISFIMVGHISAPNIIGDDTPSSLSSVMITDILRERMGYHGVVITDAMNMGAISNQYSADTAAIKAVNAGVDIILMPSDFVSAYSSIVNAVQTGEIAEKRIDESAARIIRIKQKMIR